MTTGTAPGSTTASPKPQSGVTRGAVRARRLTGGFYLVMGGINAGIVAADPQTYRTFADESFWSWVTGTWRDVVMAAPYVWFLLLASGEVILGCLLLRGGRAARWGWAGVLAFHVLLMTFGFGFWLWSVPALAFLGLAAQADWPHLVPRKEALRDVRQPGGRVVVQPETGVIGSPVDNRPRPRWTLLVLAALVVMSSLYGLLADEPYRDLPAATVTGARAQDAVSVVVALLLGALALGPRPGTAVRLLVLGLLASLAYSYLVYVSGVPMNRMFLVYVAIIAVSGAGLLLGILDVLRRPPTGRPSARLRRLTGWVLLLTSVLFAGLWLSALLPYALGGAAVEPQGVGGTPYPVFWLDLGIVLPAIGAVGVMALRDQPAAAALAVVALVKIVTLFTALWAGPVVTLITGGDVELGADAIPSLMLLAGCGWLLARWTSAMRT